MRFISLKEKREGQSPFLFSTFMDTAMSRLGRRGGDSNPRKVSLKQISSLPHSTALPPLLVYGCLIVGALTILLIYRAVYQLVKKQRDGFLAFLKRW